MAVQSKIQRLKVVIDEKLDGMRLDQALAASGIDLSRRKIRMIIDIGGVYLNRKRIRTASRAVRRGDTLQVEYNPDTLIRVRREAFSFQDQDILFQGNHLVAVNKPPGLPSQETLDQSVMHVKPCLMEYFRSKNILVRDVILVHRLDKETSGVLLLATTSKAATWMTDAFRGRDVHKTYHAICVGIPPRERFEDSSPLSEIDKNTGHVHIVRTGGRSAHTNFHVIAVNRELGLSLVECEPLTGRSHQIRVHLDHQGFPIVGDKRYGGHSGRALPDALAALASRHHMLHARRLEFVPAADKKAVEIQADYPPAFADFVKIAFPEMA